MGERYTIEPRRRKAAYASRPTRPGRTRKRRLGVLFLLLVASILVNLYLLLLAWTHEKEWRQTLNQWERALDMNEQLIIENKLLRAENEWWQRRLNRLESDLEKRG